jgi:lysophospholipase L1-like esterase
MLWTKTSKPIKSNHEKNDRTKSAYYQHRLSQFRLFNKTITENQKIVLLGDSITSEGLWHELFPSGIVLNRGIGGDTTTGLLTRLEESVFSVKQQKLFIMIGINDIFLSKVPVDFIISEYKNILNMVRKRSPTTKIYVQSVLPMGGSWRRFNTTIRKLNNRLNELCKTFKVKYIDLYDSFLNSDGVLAEKYSLDGIHPNSEGYLLWKSKIKKYIVPSKEKKSIPLNPLNPP